MTDALTTTTAPELPLGDTDALCLHETLEARGEFTGARLFSKDPKKYHAVITLLASGQGILKVAKLLGVSPHTVIAVRDREPETVAIEKERIAGIARTGARLCVEAIVDDLANPIRRDLISTKDKAIVAGVLVDKSQLLDGFATARVQFNDVGADHDAFNDELERMRRVTGETHLIGETPGQKGEAPAGAAEAASDLGEGAPESPAADPANAPGEGAEVAPTAGGNAPEPNHNRAGDPLLCKSLPCKGHDNT